MAEFDQVVIGLGASAQSFVYFALNSDNHAFKKKKILMIGEADLWLKIKGGKHIPGVGTVSGGEHIFGQPKSVVSMPNKPVERGPDAPTVQDHLTAKDVCWGQHDLKEELLHAGVYMWQGKVSSVRRSGNYLEVKATVRGLTGMQDETIRTSQVIVASGPGPSQLPGKLPEVVTKGLPKIGSHWRDNVIGGAEYLYEGKNPCSGNGFAAVVQGSSATASWAVARAVALGADKIYWLTRDHFRDADPAGRNSDILQAANEKGWLYRAEIASIEAVKEPTRKLELQLVTPGQKPAAKQLEGLLGAYQTFYKSTKALKRYDDLGLTIQPAPTDPILVDQFIFALGADPTLPGGSKWILGSELVGEMKPVFDEQCRFSNNPGDTVIAFTNKEKDVWIVGAGVFRWDPTRYKPMADMMPEDGSPPEGLAVAFAANKAVTGYIDLKKVNFRVADFKELEAWMASLYQKCAGKPASGAVKQVLADQVVALRKHTVYGPSGAELDALGDPNHPFWKDLFEKKDGQKLLIDQIVEASL